MSKGHDCTVSPLGQPVTSIVVRIGTVLMLRKIALVQCNYCDKKSLFIVLIYLHRFSDIHNVQFSITLLVFSKEMMIETTAKHHVNHRYDIMRRGEKG